MFITPIASSNFKAFIPLSEYKGPVLKLTKKEKELIAHYTHEKSLIELEIAKVNSVYDSYKVHSIDSTWYADTIGALINKRDYISKLINEIKINRLNKQKKSIAKKK